LIGDVLCTIGEKKAVVGPSFKEIRFLASGKVNDQCPMLDRLGLRIGDVAYTCEKIRIPTAQISGSKCKFGFSFRHVKFFYTFSQLDNVVKFGAAMTG
jgi:hypothetical protein